MTLRLIRDCSQFSGLHALTLFGVGSENQTNATSEFAENITALLSYRHLLGVCHLVGARGGEFVKKPLPGGGAFVNSSRRG